MCAIVRFFGQFVTPVQTTAICALSGKPLARSVRLRVCLPLFFQVAWIEPTSGG